MWATCELFVVVPAAFVRRLRPHSACQHHKLLPVEACVDLPDGDTHTERDTQQLHTERFTLKQLQTERFFSCHISSPLLRHLDANFISHLSASSFKGLLSLRHLWLDDNILSEVPVIALSSLTELQALTLALNHISSIPDRAFFTLSQLLVL